MFDNKKLYILFSIFKNKKQSVFKDHLLVILCYFHLFLRVVLRNNYIKMIKNKTLNIKITFKIYLKIIKNRLKIF